MEFEKRLAGVTKKKLIQVNLESLSYKFEFEDSILIEATYWRLSGNRTTQVSNFDHMEKYGLEQEIDVVSILNQQLKNQCLSKIVLTRQKDLHLIFDNDYLLEIFNFTGYEVWEINFSDGSGQISNYA